MLHAIDPNKLGENIISLIGDRWMLVTAGTAQDCNTMTASWGGLGVLWNKPVATIYVRPQRYTHDYLDREGYFTLTFFGEGEQREALALCGSQSGRDLDKFAATGLGVATAACGVPYAAQGALVLVCRTLYRQDMVATAFLDLAMREKHYPKQDYHTMYMGEIVEAYQA